MSLRKNSIRKNSYIFTYRIQWDEDEEGENTITPPNNGYIDVKLTLIDQTI